MLLYLFYIYLFENALQPNSSYRSIVLAELSKYFGSQILNPLSYVEVNWSENTFIGGCPFSIPGMGTLKYFKEYQTAVGRYQNIAFFH